MEQSAIGQSIFKRMLLYHWYRQGDNYQTASRKLCHDYGERFVSLKQARQTFECFRLPDFDFEKFCQGEAEAEAENDYAEVSIVSESKDEQATAIDSILQEFSTDLPTEYAYSEPIVVVSSSPMPATKGANVPRPSTSQTPASVTSCISLPELEELRPYFTPPSEMSECDYKMIRRWRVRRCFESHYSLRETEKTLNNLFGSYYVNHNFIERWFHNFSEGHFALENRAIRSGKKIGRPPRYDPEPIVSFFLQNPHASTKDCQKQFPNLATHTIQNIIKEHGFVRRFNSWARRDPNEPEVSDEQLAEYKLRNPDAKAWEIGQHFGIFHIGIDSRLRALGFNIPSWSKKVKKKEKSNDHDNESNELEQHDESSNSSFINELSDLMSELEEDNSSFSTANQNTSLLNFNRGVYTPKRKSHGGGRPQNSKNILNKNRLIDPLTGQPISSIIDPAFMRLKLNSVLTDKKKPKKEPKVNKELDSILNPPTGSSSSLPPIPKPKFITVPKKENIKSIGYNTEYESLSSVNPADEMAPDSSHNLSSTFVSERMFPPKKRIKKTVLTDPNLLELPEELEEQSSISLTFDPLSNLEQNLEMVDNLLSNKKSTSGKSNIVRVKVDSFPAKIAPLKQK